MLYVPRGFLHGFQVLSEVADICYRIDRPHDPTEDLSVRYDDPDLGHRLAAPGGHPQPARPGRGLVAGPHCRQSSAEAHRCRGCGSTRGEVVLDLGDQPAADHFPLVSDPGPDPRHPLAMWWCAECGLAQLRDDATRSRGAARDGAPRRRQAGLGGRATSSSTPVCSHPAEFIEFPSPHGGSWSEALLASGFRPAAGTWAGVVVDVYGLMHDADQADALLARVRR